MWAVPEPWGYAYRPPYLSEAQGSLPRASASGSACPGAAPTSGAPPYALRYRGTTQARARGGRTSGAPSSLARCAQAPARVLQSVFDGALSKAVIAGDESSLRELLAYELCSLVHLPSVEAKAEAEAEAKAKQERQAEQMEGASEGDR